MSRPRRTWIGIAVAVAIAALAYPGVRLWAQTRAEHDVEAAFGTLRTVLAAATYDSLDFDPSSRTLTLANVTLKWDDAAATTMKVGRVAISGIAEAASEGFAAQHIDIKDIDLTSKDINVPSDANGTIRIAFIALEDVALKSSKPYTELLDLIRTAPADPSPAAVRALLEKIAELCEQVRIGKFHMQGVKLAAPPDRLDLAALLFNGFENGRVAEFALEGLQFTPPQADKAVDARRFALNGLDVAGLLRASAHFSTKTQNPTPHELVGLLALLQGIEVRGFTGPDEPSGELIYIESFSASWGQFVGTVPSAARVAAKVAVPVTPTHPDPFLRQLAAAGRREVVFNFDVAAAWTAETRTFRVGPAAFEMEGLFSTSTTLLLANVLPGIFATDLIDFLHAATGLEAGAIEYSFQDRGGVDFWIRQFAEIQGLPIEAARKRLIDEMNQVAAVSSAVFPEIQRVMAAVGQVIETPGAVLKFNLTPKGRVNIMQMFELMKLDPMTALSRFDIDARVNP